MPLFNVKDKPLVPWIQTHPGPGGYNPGKITSCKEGIFHAPPENTEERIRRPSR